MKTIFDKEYDSESLCDLSRDVHEAFNNDFNPTVADIPKDEYGFHEGRFIVTIKWVL